MQNGLGHLQTEAGVGLKKSQKFHFFHKVDKQLRDADACLDKLVEMAKDNGNDDARALLQMGLSVRQRCHEAGTAPKSHLKAMQQVLTAVQNAAAVGFGPLASLATQICSAAGGNANLARDLYGVAAERSQNEADQHFSHYLSALRDAGADPTRTLQAAYAAGRELSHYAAAGRASGAPSGAVLVQLQASGLDQVTAEHFITPMQAWSQPLSEAARGVIDAAAVERLTHGAAQENDVRQVAVSVLPSLPEADRSQFAARVLDDMAQTPPSEVAQAWLALRGTLETHLAGHAALGTMRTALLTRALGNEAPGALNLAAMGETVAAADQGNVAQQVATLRMFTELAAQQGGDAQAPYFARIAQSLAQLPSDQSRAQFLRAALLGGALGPVAAEANLASAQKTSVQWPALFDAAPPNERVSLGQHLVALQVVRLHRDGDNVPAIFYEHLAPTLAVPMAADDQRQAVARQMVVSSCTPGADVVTLGNQVAGMGDRLGQPRDSRAFYHQAAEALWQVARSQHDELNMARLDMVKHLASRAFPTVTAQPRALRAGMTSLAVNNNQSEAVSLSTYGSTVVNSGYGMGNTDFVQAYGSVARELDMWGTAHGDDTMRDQARCFNSLLESDLTMEQRYAIASVVNNSLARGLSANQTLQQFVAAAGAGVSDVAARQHLYRVGLEALDTEAQAKNQQMTRSQIDFLRGVLELPIDATSQASLVSYALASPTFGAPGETAVAQVAVGAFANQSWTARVRLAVTAAALRTMSQRPGVTQAARDVLVPLRNLCTAEFYQREEQARVAQTFLPDVATNGIPLQPGRFAAMGLRMINSCTVAPDKALVGRTMLSAIDQLVQHTGGANLPDMPAALAQARESVAADDVPRMTAALDNLQKYAGDAYQPA